MTRRRRSERAGLSLLEVVVSSALLAGIALIALSSAMPLTKASSGTATTLDLDRAAAQVLAELRRELRASGYDRGTARFGENAPGDGGLALARPSIVFATRKDEDTWSADVRWSHDPEKEVVLRTAGSHPIELARHVESLTFQVRPGDRVCEVDLVLSRADPSDGTKRITRRYADRVEMMNR